MKNLIKILFLFSCLPCSAQAPPSWVNSKAGEIREKKLLIKLFASFNQNETVIYDTVFTTFFLFEKTDRTIEIGNDDSTKSKRILRRIYAEDGYLITGKFNDSIVQKNFVDINYQPFPVNIKVKQF